MKNNIRDIVFQIRSRRDDLSVTERKVADAILDNIIWSASATVDQLAAKASVSIATISRFARTVGCEDTRDLKMKLAQASTVGSRFLTPPRRPRKARSTRASTPISKARCARTCRPSPSNCSARPRPSRTRRA